MKYTDSLRSLVRTGAVHSPVIILARMELGSFRVLVKTPYETVMGVPPTLSWMGLSRSFTECEKDGVVDCCTILMTVVFF